VVNRGLERADISLVQSETDRTHQPHGLASAIRNTRSALR
jgi:hypothetical protein